MDNSIFDLLFSVFGSIIDVMQRVTFLGVSVFYWSIGFIIMGAVMAALLNTLRSPFVSTTSHDLAAARRSSRRSGRNSNRGE